MKKLIYVFMVVSLITISLSTISEAKTYVLRSKTTGEPQGTASISDEAISDWAEKFIIVEADSSYRGKHKYEIKYENGELRHATQEEIDTYLQEKEQEQEDAIDAKKKQEFLDLLEDIDIIDKIKDKVKP